MSSSALATSSFSDCASGCCGSDRLAPARQHARFELGADRFGVVVFNGEAHHIVRDTRLPIPHHMGSATFIVGPTRAQQVLQMASFDQTLHGARFFWSLPSLHALLGISVWPCHKWVNRSIISWERLATLMGTPQQLLRSKSSEPGAILQNPLRVLPWCGCGTAVLLALLLKGAFKLKALGGLQLGKDRSAAAAFLKILLGVISKASGFVINLFMGRAAAFP